MDQRPIGYWLKRLDRLLEQTFEQALAREGLSRRHWQVLSTLADSPGDRQHLAAALDPFWDEDTVTLDDVTAELIHEDAGEASFSAACDPVGAPVVSDSAPARTGNVVDRGSRSEQDAAVGGVLELPACSP